MSKTLHGRNSTSVWLQCLLANCSSRAATHKRGTRKLRCATRSTGSGSGPPWPLSLFHHDQALMSVPPITLLAASPSPRVAYHTFSRWAQITGRLTCEASRACMSPLVFSTQAPTNVEVKLNVASPALSLLSSLVLILLPLPPCFYPLPDLLAQPGSASAATVHRSALGLAWPPNG